VSVREKDFEFIFEGVETLSEDAKTLCKVAPEGQKNLGGATLNLFRVFIAKEEGIPELE
jgi:hypothetical protein